jgi:hypothetical protein
MPKPKMKSEWRRDWLRYIKNMRLLRPGPPPVYTRKTTEDRRNEKN